jgi:hypothetical protein
VRYTMPMVPATLERKIVVGGQSRQISRPYLTNNSRQKVLRVSLKVECACLARTRPCDQIPVIFFFFFFCCTEAWTQSLTLARQVHLSYSTSPKLQYCPPKSTLFIPLGMDHSKIPAFQFSTIHTTVKPQKPYFIDYAKAKSSLSKWLLKQMTTGLKRCF